MNSEIAFLREVCIRVTQLLAGMSVRVTQQGTQAFVETDPRTLVPKRVNIPHIPDNATEDLILAIQGFIDHEVAHILFTDWSVVKKTRMMGSAIDGLQNIVEDTYIERAMAKKFPGSVWNLEKLHHFFLAKITKPALDKVAGNPDNEFGVLVVVMARAWSGQAVFADFMKREGLWARMKPFVDKIGDLALEFPKIKTSQQALDLAIKLDEALNKRSKKEKSSPPASLSPPPATPPHGKGKGDGESKGEKAEGAESKENKDDGGAGDEAGKPEPIPEMDDEGGEPDKPAPGRSSEDGDKAEADDEPDDAAGEDEEVGTDRVDAGDDEDDAGVVVGGGDEDKDADGDDEDERDGDIPEMDDEGGAGDDDRKSERRAAAGSDPRADGGCGEDQDAASRDSGGCEDADEDGGDAGDGEADGSDAVGTWNSRIAEEALKSGDFDKSLEAHIGADAMSATRASDYRIFTKDFDTIERFPVPESAWKDSYMVSMEDQTRHMVGVMQKDIERMMAARSQAVKVPGFRSGRLHSAALHRLASNDDRVFRRTQENRSKELVVGLLIDNSGSMGGSKMHTAMAAGYALSQTLERVGIRHEVLGFTTCTGRGIKGYVPAVIHAEEARMGRPYSRSEPIYMPIFKDFHERLAPEVKRRFAYAPHAAFLANNIDGECVETAVLRLLKERAERRVLLVLSDGQPAALGNGPEQVAYLKRAVLDAERKGVETVGIGILSDAPRHYYPKSIVLRDLNALPVTVMAELKKILLR